MASNDYIPADDAGLVAFATAFALKFATDAEDYGFTPAETTDLTNSKTVFAGAVADVTAKQTAAKASVSAKNTARENLVTMLRSIVRRLQANPSVDDAMRTQYGITVRDTTPTAIAAPTSQPVLFVDTSKRLEHTIKFQDALTPLSTAKPAGVLGCEIYRKVGGTAPASISECEFLGLDSASPFQVQYGSVDGGKTVFYIARWANRNGLTGPQSDVISATVVA